MRVLALAFLLSPVAARAQEGVPADAALQGEASIERIDARVTRVEGRFVSVDRGRSSGLQVGDRVLLYPRGAAAVEGEVRLVEDHRARVELGALELALEAGDRGEVLLPAGRVVATPAPVDAPEHPPWQRSLDEWSDEQPLLAPVKSPTPPERPSELHGRVFTRFDYLEDRLEESRRYYHSRTGLDLDWSNPFGAGGRFTFDGEFSYRESQVDGGDDDSRTITRLERLSYAWGGERTRNHRVEVGRFLQREFPELGVLDGAEYAFRLPSGSRLGASFGALPGPFDEMANTDDVGGSVYYRQVLGERGEAELGAAYKKTWHDGEADRDLIVATADWRIARRTRFSGSAWIDLYGDDELQKEEGVELTELHLRLDQRFDAAGLGLFASRIQWPDLRRDELPPTTDDGVLEHRVARAGIDGWTQLNDLLRLGARIEGWEDEVDTGGSGDFRVGLRDLIFDRDAYDLTIYGTQGRFSDGRGLRFGARKWFGASSLRLGYELREFDQQGFSGEQSSLSTSVFSIGLDFAIGADWTLALDGEGRFGDAEDVLGIGFFLQRSF